ncbi:19453_t:CDS:2, partial [Racocetra fulgida]
MFSANKRKQFTSSNSNDTIPQIPRRNKDTKAPKTSDSSEVAADAATITRTTTTTTVTTVTTTISAKNPDGSGPLYLDLGDFSFSPLEPDENGGLLTSSSISSTDDAKKTAHDSSASSSPITSNSSIYDTPTIKLTSKNLSDLDDTPYVLAFSLLMLHTDAFNKNVKRKMTKEDFIKNTRIDGVNPEILEILYDNIIYTPFIYAEDDVDVNGQTMLESPTSDHRQLKIFSSSKDKRKSMRPRNDPYHVIQTKQPTEFKPYLKDIIPVENPYSYIGTLPSLDIVNLHRAFSSAQTIRITGVQNRRNGDQFSSTTSSFQPSKDGTFLLKITKGGKLGRKVDLIDGKKK